MKPSKKKPAKKSSKSKSPGGVPVKKKATTKKPDRAVEKSKPTKTRVKTSEKAVNSTQTEIQRLSGQLKQKDRELEIEASLERVRSRSIAMRQSKELGDLSFELVKQVQALGIATWHCAFNIYDEDQESSTEWGSNANGSYPIYKTPRKGIFKRYYEVGQSGETLHVEVIGEDKCADHYAYLCTLPGVGDTLVKLRDSGTPFPKSQIDHVAYFKYGYLLFITFVPAPEAHDVFKRFAKVFEQTYTRFLDLQKAEAQVKEAQIQLALERVRARTMAMQHSNELRDAASVLFQQVKELGIDAWTCGFSIWDEDRKAPTAWLSRGIIQPPFKTPLTENPTLMHFYEAAQRGESLFVEEVSGETLNELYRYLGTLLVAAGISAEIRKPGYSPPTFQVNNVAYFSYGYLLFVTYKQYPEAHDIFKRFAKVFEQTYTRFLDLQKAEAQAKEAQIEAALERVRSRSMGMQRSAELKEVIQVVYDQFIHLNIPIGHTGFIMDYKSSDDMLIWLADQHEVPSQVTIPYFDSPHWNSFNEAREKGKGFFANKLTFEEKNRFYEKLFEFVPGLPEESKEYYFCCPGLAISTVLLENIGLYIENFSGIPYSEEENGTLMRFGKVFQQTYTRFLDLQKAEAQARESQIEAALERVRSRTMAMQKSQELPDAANLLFHQVQTLGMPAWSAGYCIWDEDKQGITLWMSSEGVIQPPFHAPLSQDPSFVHMREAYERGETFHVEELGGEACKVHYEYMRKLPVVGEILDSIIKAGHPLPTYQIFHCSYFTQGFLLFITYEAVPEAWDIFKRFAKVFEQTYTRFLDLQKSEAQAREAKIEAVLERVRGRTMAMHKSEELTDVAGLLFEQVSTLDIKTWTAGFNVWSEDNNSYVDYITSPQGGFIEPYTVYTEKPEALTDISNARKSGVEFDVLYVEGEKIKQLYLALTKLDEKAYEIMLQDGVRFPSHQYEHFVFGSKVSLMFITYEPVPEAHDIFKRLGKVFEQTYTRFLDLQKAEAQTREAQIEASLERVRSKAMAMHKSEDLTAAVAVVFEELEKLDLGMSRCGIGILNKEKRSAEVWTTSKSEGQNAVDVSGDESMDIHPLLQKAFDAWLRHEDLTYVLQGGDLADYYRALQHTNFRLPESQAMLQNAEMHQQHYYMASFQAGGLYAFRDNPFVDEAKNVIKRFTNVFNLTYKRFQDIQKAEAQAREAQIEASLERVRSKTMAMHNSHDVGDTVANVFDELIKLGVKTNRCGILIFSDSNDTEVWTARSTPSGKANLIIGHLDVALHPMLTSARNTWKNKETTFSYEMIGDDVINYYESISNQPGYPIQVNMETLPSKEIHSEFYFPEGAVFAFTSELIAPDDAQIFKRLAGVFGQTYRRYLDLKKAEAQARESQIEAALERVRSRTMAMHRSEEIADIVGRIFRELTLLDVALNRVLIWIFNPDEKYFSWWSANPEAERNAESYRVDYNEHPVFLTYYEGWKKRSPLLLYTLGGDVKASWEDHLFKNTELARLPKAVQDGMRSEKQIFTTSAISDFGLLMAGCFEPFSDEVNDIIQRFGRVFQQSYTRYVDVQKAEAQAREATIEASLEKVRGKAMAMHNSNDLASTASLVFTELRKLGINSFRNGVGLLTKENRNVKLYSATSSEEGGTFSVVGWAVLDNHPVLSKTYDSWINNEDYFPILKGESLSAYYEKVVATFTVPVEQSEGYEQHGYFLPFSEGLFYGWSEKPFTEQEIKILNRFRGIVDLTFRRYIELQKSEENAKEAIRQASLDRVRAEIASMRTTTDLDRITPLIWKELNILSIPFVRCGVFIMDELQHQMHTFLSTPDGKAIAAFHLPYETPGNVGQILSHWQNKKMYIEHWDEKAFSELGDLLIQQKAIPSKDTYMSTVPGGGVHLHCLPFLQGMLYVGNTTELQQDDIHLIQSVADAFSTAYARYEDFNKLESAKAQIEKTFTDLKQTQNLLVQSEKMASLGELTAGIAHEIQNPLNFVNNFSEVSNELLEEMKEEIEKGNYDEVEALTNNIKQNLEKILHHGKRADGIVKGMLQHSRSSTGVKEPTDINALADEYLRLAYHGFRAKDKSFNASTNTDLDRSIGNINVVPQDIGRVILNLITNAFFAVTEKQKQTGADYQPTVSLSTKRHDNFVLISVKDNGNGIPKQIREKIFQPFFTTKPTGQGTGLGLSLSYDIVKAHGGELRVETTEGEGSEFVVSIML